MSARHPEQTSFGERGNRARYRSVLLLLRSTSGAATLAHPDVAAREVASDRYYRECVAACNRDDFSGYAEMWSPDIIARTWGGPTICGRALLVQTMGDNTLRAGVRVCLDRVIASSQITVLEARLENPPETPDHCPPVTTQVHFHPDGQTRSILFAFGQERASTGALTT